MTLEELSRVPEDMAFQSIFCLFPIVEQVRQEHCRPFGAESGRNPVLGKEMPVVDYLAVMDILKPLWKNVGIEASHKVRIANHVRLFDARQGEGEGLGSGSREGQCLEPDRSVI